MKMVAKPFQQQAAWGRRHVYTPGLRRPAAQAGAIAGAATLRLPPCRRRPLASAGCAAGSAATAVPAALAGRRRLLGVVAAVAAVRGQCLVCWPRHQRPCSWKPKKNTQIPLIQAACLPLLHLLLRRMAYAACLCPASHLRTSAYEPALRTRKMPATTSRGYRVESTPAEAAAARRQQSHACWSNSRNATSCKPPACFLITCRQGKNQCDMRHAPSA